MKNPKKPPLGVREMMRRTAETLAKDAGDDRADLGFCIDRAIALLMLIRADRATKTADSREQPR